MAVTNRDRIGQMSKSLRQHSMPSFSGRSNPAAGRGRLDVHRRDAAIRAAIELGRRPIDRLDPQVQLRMLAENVTGQYKQGWYPFDGLLTRSHKARPRELRDCRNTWAHNESFNNDDAYRAWTPRNGFSKQLQRGGGR